MTSYVNVKRHGTKRVQEVEYLRPHHQMHSLEWAMAKLPILATAPSKEGAVGCQGHGMAVACST